MRQKFQRQGFRHFVVAQRSSSKSQEYLFATSPTFAAKLQGLLLRVQATKSEGMNWIGTSLGQLLHPRSGELIRDDKNLRGNHVLKAIEQVRRAAGTHSEGNMTAGVWTPGEKQRAVGDAGDERDRVPQHLDSSGLVGGAFSDGGDPFNPVHETAKTNDAFQCLHECLLIAGSGHMDSEKTTILTSLLTERAHASVVACVVREGNWDNTKPPKFTGIPDWAVVRRELNILRG